MEHQGDASADTDLGRFPGSRRWRPSRRLSRRIRTIGCCGDSTGCAWKGKLSATVCWPSAGVSTWRTVDRRFIRLCLKGWMRKYKAWIRGRPRRARTPRGAGGRRGRRAGTGRVRADHGRGARRERSHRRHRHRHLRGRRRREQSTRRPSRSPPRPRRRAPRPSRSRRRRRSWRAPPSSSSSSSAASSCRPPDGHGRAVPPLAAPRDYRPGAPGSRRPAGRSAGSPGDQRLGDRRRAAGITIESKHVWSPSRPAFSHTASPP